MSAARSLALLALLVFTFAAGCDSPSALDTKSAEAVKAADAFVALAKDSATTGVVPRETDPEVKKLLDAVFDTSALQSGPVQPMSEIQPINDWNLAVLKVGLVYILAGTGITDVAAIPNDEKVAAKINQNTVDYAPETGRYIDAQLHIQEALMDTVGEFLATAPDADKDKPNVKEGVADIKSGIARTMLGVITTLPIEGLSDEWRRERLKVLNGMAPKAVKFLVPEDLKALQDASLEVAGKMSSPEVKAELETLSKALQPQA